MSVVRRILLLMTHAADQHTNITVLGAREHNLKGVSVTIPKRRLTVFTGVSGSGKSSLVFHTIAAESQRLINETYSAFVQGFMPTLPRPNVDVLEGVTTAIIVDQKPLGQDPRSTVGTASDVNALLRILFSRIASPHIGNPQAYSFNVASVSGAGAVSFEKDGKTIKERRSFSVTGGMCPRCEGRGLVSGYNHEALFDASKTLEEGAILVPGYSMSGWWGRIFGALFALDKPLRDFTTDELDLLLNAEPTKLSVEGINVTYEGLIPRIEKSMLQKDREAMQAHVRAFVDRAITFTECPECEGTRLSELTRSSRIEGKNIADLCRMQISDLLEWLPTVSDERVEPLLASLTATLQSFVDIGLGYLSLDRPAGSLSGGEAQRTKMIRHLGSSLTDVTYVFDEPTIGLHPHDIERMNRLLLDLRDKGNTVLVVEHKPETIAIADHVIDLGPAAGALGGELCYEGDVAGLRASGTLTGKHLDDRSSTKQTVRERTGSLPIRGAAMHNLENVDVDVPLGVLTVVTGVAGSGKSSLVHGSISTQPGVAVIDQTPIRGSRRSNPATYTGMFDGIRSAFAKANGVKPALFSSNSAGACPECKGVGEVSLDLGVLAEASVPCPVCEGRRYSDEVLQYHLEGRNIVEVLAMSMNDALAFVQQPGVSVPKAKAVLARLVDVGLGYLTLGQPLSTLSGGERQRLKLAMTMAEDASIYVLDEPTTGLHLADVERLLELLDRLVESGKSVIVVEHHQAVMAHADWIIDLGPGAGHEGGRIVFEGSPEQLVKARSTLTGEHLARYVA
ncbi:excinuclease ABC subunit UvrA [Leucobacter sp. UCMA 4100]|nr:excinuclease ABC subunit UvrA [Leucobacter sp. UCMA 4100]